MQSIFLNNLKKKNEYPVIFIGSGITQRYFRNAPTWDQLLDTIWQELNMEQSYYLRSYELSQKYDGNNFELYSKFAEEIEHLYNVAFFYGKVTLKNLSQKEAHQQKRSPFRAKIAEIFANLEKKEGVDDEIKLFKAMLKKARMIITTNYDLFIEDQLEKIDVKVGDKGLFEPAGEYNELYKIHGSIDDPESIVITKKDYQKLERTSAIVNAKILTELTTSPIIFLGYSLTDGNVVSLMNDLIDNMPFSIDKTARRIGVVDYEKGREDFFEAIKEGEFNCTRIRTDNFAEIYRTVASIDQGISPREISKYQTAFKQIIEKKGKEGNLNEVLTSAMDLERLPEELKSKNLVVAFGDKRFIYKYPDYVSYIKNYFLEEKKIPLEIALKFISGRPSNSALPISVYVSQIDEGTPLGQLERLKINKRLKKFCSLESLNVKNISRNDEEILQNRKFENQIDILKENDVVKVSTKIIYFTRHIDEYDQKFSLDLIKLILEKNPDGYIQDTNCRKLFMAYSLLHETIISEI